MVGRSCEEELTIVGKSGDGGRLAAELGRPDLLHLVSVPEPDSRVATGGNDCLTLRTEGH